MRQGRAFFLAAILCAAALPAASPAPAQTREQLDKLRAQMVDEVIIASGIKNKRVIEAMGKTQRHLFVASKHYPNAYYDMALPIGEQQTISSPFIVAYMTESLDPQPTDKVLEIGTGSGYQAAVLSPLVKEVYTIEIVESLGKSAARKLKELNYKNVHVKVGDGFQGWAEHAPFNKIIVTCSPEKVPQPLVDQLADGGMMVVPVGERYQQTLYLFRKEKDKLERVALRPTLFVPMTGKAEDNRVVKPDPNNPQVQNPSFEEVAETEDKNFVPGWYYHRLTTWEEDPKAPDGKHCIAFENTITGRASHLLQGFPIDGRTIAEVQLGAWAKTKDVVAGKELTEIPVVAVTFYDDQRRDLGTAWVGPFRGTEDWHVAKKTIRVPEKAREGILRLGLFGATGKVWFDNISLVPVRRNVEGPGKSTLEKLEER